MTTTFSDEIMIAIFASDPLKCSMKNAARR